MGSTAYLLVSLVLSSVGMGYFIYGKKQGKASSLFAGAALMIYPFFVTGMLLLVVLGVPLMALPFLTEF